MSSDTPNTPAVMPTQKPTTSLDPARELEIRRYLEEAIGKYVRYAYATLASIGALLTFIIGVFGISNAIELSNVIKQSETHKQEMIKAMTDFRSDTDDQRKTFEKQYGQLTVALKNAADLANDSDKRARKVAERVNALDKVAKNADLTLKGSREKLAEVFADALKDDEFKKSIVKTVDEKLAKARSDETEKIRKLEADTSGYSEIKSELESLAQLIEIYETEHPRMGRLKVLEIHAGVHLGTHSSVGGRLMVEQNVEAPGFPPSKDKFIGLPANRIR